VARIIAQLLTALVANEHGLSAGDPMGETCWGSVGQKPGEQVNNGEHQLIAGIGGSSSTQVFVL